MLSRTLAGALVLHAPVSYTHLLPGGGTGSGTAIDVDADGQLIVRTDSGEEKVFTGEVSVRGIYGAV